MRSNIKRASSKKRMLILSLLILLLCLSIGYATLSQSINMNTVADVDKMTWDVHLENVVVRSGSVSAIPPVISNDKTSVSLTVTFSQPNEYYEFYIDIVNKGSINAQVDSVLKTSLTSSQAKFIDYKITYKDGIEIKKNDILASGEKETLKVLVYIKDLHESLYPTIKETLKLEGKIIYIQKNDDGVVRNKNSLYEGIKKQTQPDTGINFGEISSDTNGKGVYTLSRTASYAYPVHYYRGDVTNNNVIFGGFCWKIIRTTTTGGIKMIYNGIADSGVCNATGDATEIGKSAFNIESNDPKYVGYMYDNNTKDSAIKRVIDEWFANNLVNYQDYLEDTPFYNERDYLEEEGIMSFAPRIRIHGLVGSDILDSVSKTTIKLGATNIEDVFTTRNTLGNGALTYSVGLITSDEIVLAGGKGRTAEVDENREYYLYNNLTYWTMSPYQFIDYAFCYNVGAYGNLSYGGSLPNNLGVRPVLALKSNTIYTTGDGTSTSPYVITN